MAATTAEAQEWQTVSEGGGTGLYKDGDGYGIVLPRGEFKNSRSSWWTTRKYNDPRGEEYRTVLETCDTSIIDEYITQSRPGLLLGRPDPGALFVTDRGTPMNRANMAYYIRRFTWRYVVFHSSSGTGIPGVETFGPHAFRDITATHILKVTGDAALAGDAIQDTAATVLRHYGQYLPSDRLKRVNAFLSSEMGGVPWDSG